MWRVPAGTSRALAMASARGRLYPCGRGYYQKSWMRTTKRVGPSGPVGWETVVSAGGGPGPVDGGTGARPGSSLPTKRGTLKQNTDKD